MSKQGEHPDRIKAIAEMPQPKSRQDVNWLLGLVNYLQPIPAVPNSAVIWVLAMLSPIPKSSIDLMCRFGTVPRAPITTGRVTVCT